MIYTLGNRIKTAMTDAGLTQTQVASRLNVTPQSVYGWIKTSTIKKGHLSNLALLLGVTTDWLVTGDHYTPSAIADISQEVSQNAARNEALNIGRKVQTAPTEVKNLILQLIELAETNEKQSIETSKALILLTKVSTSKRHSLTHPANPPSCGFFYACLFILSFYLFL
jgi:transcriptional regulator with XRE-family HTH domain